jgi:hypothetical protein
VEEINPMTSPCPAVILRIAGASLVAFVLSALTGCGAAKGTITGEVKYNGKALSAGQVTFYSESDGKQVQAAGIKGGFYTIADFPAGPVRITVQTFPPPTKDVKLSKELAIVPPGASLDDLSRPRGEFVRIPPTYAKAASTDLRYTVTAGQQTHDIELKAAGTK